MHSLLYFFLPCHASPRLVCAFLSHSPLVSSVFFPFISISLTMMKAKKKFSSFFSIFPSLLYSSLMPDLILVVVDVDVVVFGSCSWGKVNGTKKKSRKRVRVLCSSYISLPFLYILHNNNRSRRKRRRK